MSAAHLTGDEAYARLTDRRSQLEKLVAVSRAIEGAMHDAGKGDLWVSRSGAVLANALYDLTQCDELYEMQRHAEFTCGITADGDRVLFLGDERSIAA